MQLNPPHGGRLINRWADLEDMQTQAILGKHNLLKIELDDVRLCDLECLADGALSPLEGFMGEKTYHQVLDVMELPEGLVWPFPIILPVTQTVAEQTQPGQKVLLTSAGQTLGWIEVSGHFKRNPTKEANRIYGTLEEDHPGVARVMSEPEYALAGTVTVVRLPERPFPEQRLTPTQTRSEFVKRGWKTVVAFQTRNPIHRAHEYITKCALEVVDGLLIHPLVGTTKSDDIPANVRMKCYETLMSDYYPADRTMLSVFPAAMRYAGPREALFHAIVRKNYGCTHLIVGRDHAGVGDYYHPFAAHAIFDRFEPGDIGIIPLRFDATFYCKQCVAMASYKTCPHAGEHHVALSGTKVRKMLSEGVYPPAEFSRPEVAAILVESYRQRFDPGI